MIFNNIPLLFIKSMIIIVICFFGYLLAFSRLSYADDAGNGYQLGKGYALGNTGIGLGGYASSHGEALGRLPGSFSLSNLSLFVTWDNGSKIRFFSETEAENILTLGGRSSLSVASANLHFERLYFDYLLTDTVSIRLGKILTPVGQWNLIHVDPLVWTTTRPVATTNLFSDYATGAMLQGTLLVNDRLFEYAIYGDYSSQLDFSNADTVSFDNAQGSRIKYHLTDELQLGLSYVDYALQGSTNVRNHLTGFDFAWEYKRFSLNSEVVYRNASARVNNSAWQGYLQGVSPLTDHLYAVGRYEFFDFTDRHFSGMGQAEVFGLTYRPQPALAFKMEYRLGKNNRGLAPDGLFASFSMLF